MEGNKDRYGRLIAICYANEMNLNSTMVTKGWAIACRYYSNDYINEEGNAKKNKRGILNGSFIEQYIWRKNNKLLSQIFDIPITSSATSLPLKSAP